MTIKDQHASERAALEKKLRSTYSSWDRLPLLLELAREPTRNDLNYAFQCAQEALGLAKELKDPFWIARSMRSIGILLFRTSRYSEVLHYLSEAARTFEQLHDTHMKAQTDVPIANTYFYMGKWEEGFRLLLPCRQIFEAMGPPYWLATTFRSLGTFYQGIGDHSNAILHYRRAIDIAIESNLETDIGGYYANLATVYGSMEDMKEMKRYTIQAFRVFREAGWKVGIAGVSSNLAIAYLKQNRFNQAEKYIRLSGAIYRELGHRLYEAMEWGHLGSVYANREEFPRALRCFRKAISMATESENLLMRGALYQGLGECHLGMGNYRHGIAYLKRALPMIQATDQKSQLASIHQRLSEGYEKLGQTSQALRHYKKYTRIREEYLNAEKSFEAGQAEMRDRIAALSRELENEEIKSAALRREIEKKEQALVARALSLIEKAEETRRKKRTINCSTPEDVDKTSENWELFFRQFNKVHSGFYPKLVRSFPNLTPTEIKVCSLIRIGLSSKEIAGLLCISKRTVDNHRTHVHKKMALPNNVSLAKWIMRM